ncbi:MAG: HD family phosphohydrolase, partial [Desulfobacterales bacterium]
MNIDKKNKSLITLIRTYNLTSWAILIGIAIIYAIILYPNLVVPIKSYTLGDVVEKDIKATRDFFIEDKEATQIKQKEATYKVLTVYDHDADLALKLIQNVKQAFSDLRKIILSERKQRLENLPLKPGKPQSLSDTNKRDFEKKLGINVSDGAFNILIKDAFSENIANGITLILRKLFENGVVTNKEILLKEVKKGIVLRTVGTGSERVVQNLKQFYGHDQAKTMVRIIGQPFLKNVNYILRNLIVDFSQRLIQPNITLNRNETEIRKREASEKIKPILYRIKAGEMILREGERVTKTQLLKLKALQAGTKWKKALASTMGAATLILSFLVIAYILLLNHNQIRPDNQKNLLFIATILIVFLFIAKVSASFSESLPENGPLSLTPSSIYFG